MTVTTEYQPVYCRRDKIVITVRMQIIAASFLLAALLAKVWIKIETTDMGYRLARERQFRIDYDQERRELELQRSILLRADNLTQKASVRLKLGPLNPKQARRISMQKRLKEA